jgi:NAD dependent epimerase/dehydratase family enzyme
LNLLVTGTTGFVGKHLYKQLKANNSFTIRQLLRQTETSIASTDIIYKNLNGNENLTVGLEC